MTDYKSHMWQRTHISVHGILNFKLSNRKQVLIQLLSPLPSLCSCFTHEWHLWMIKQSLHLHLQKYIPPCILNLKSILHYHYYSETQSYILYIRLKITEKYKKTVWPAINSSDYTSYISLCFCQCLPLFFNWYIPSYTLEKCDT